MALMQCSFSSEVLGIMASMNVILPQKPDRKKKKYPVLYLLHGLSDDHTAWLRRTSIERYADLRELAVVMPAVNRSFYTDMKYGYRYGTFMSDELPSIVQCLFPISDKREDNFVAGLSMGGYGALKLALGNPDKYAAAASLSGAVDLVGRHLTEAEILPDIELIFENREKIKGSKDDLFYLAEKVAASDGPKPKIYQCCGTEDFLYEDNVRFRDFMEKLPFDYLYEEEPGMHEWGYWDKKIQNVLRWLPIKKQQ